MESFTKKRIVVIEDDPTMKHIWELIFKRIGRPIECLWFNSITEFERSLKGNYQAISHFDLCITDIFFPETKTGLEFWLRHEKYLRNKTLVVSSLAQDKIDQFLGNRDYYPFYLKKPLDITECIELLKWIFNHQSPPSVMKKYASTELR